jgi:hypothetical protein
LDVPYPRVKLGIDEEYPAKHVKVLLDAIVLNHVF